MHRLIRIRRLALSLALLPVLTTMAQEGPPAATVEGARTYTPSDFARYAPRNALDMLEQVPGFQIREADFERGLGEATGNVLINGQRLSGKSNDVITQLSRIPAGNVVRIEIRDGATLDIPGLSGQVANVVAKAGGIRGQWSWRPDFRRFFTDPQLTRGEISISGATSGLDWTLGFSNQANHSGAGGETLVYNADGTFREFRHDVWTGESERPRLSGSLAWTGANGQVANLNAAYHRFDFAYIEDGTRRGPGLPDRARSVRHEEGGYHYEVGGDYEFALGGGRLKLIGLNRFVHLPLTETVVTKTFDGSTPDHGSRYSRDGDELERIGRAEYRWKAGGGDWQLSGEYAFNRLESVSELFVLQPDGSFAGVPLPRGSATVEEDRYEVMASFGRPLTPDLALQVNLGGEYSRLEQVGGGGLARSFRRPKGLVSLAWKATPGLDLNMKLQRRVGQLNFFGFLASVDLADEQANAGNPELVPPQTWELDLEAVRDLGAFGNTTLRVYGQRIDDIVDTIPIGADGESPGNLDRATRYGIEWKGTFQLEPFGWRGARLDALVQFEHSRVRDPLTGEQRPISNNLAEGAELALRHDVSGTEWAWGGSASYWFREKDYRLTGVGRLWEGPVWASLFVEHKNVLGMTVRFTAGNLLSATSMWHRTVYEDRRTGPVAFFEARDRTIGPIFNLSFSGKF
jgi:hypothetical protein